MQLADFIEQSVHSPSTDDAFALLKKFAAARGFDYVAYGTLTNHTQIAPPGAIPPAVELNYPIEWQRHYFENSYQLLDPVLLLAPHMHRPFSWDWVQRNQRLDYGQKTLFLEADAAGLRAGISVPLHGPLGNVSVLSFASMDKGHDLKPHMGQLQAIAAQFQMVYLDLTIGKTFRSSFPRLSHRERDCLQWSAQGKSSWDIGMILGISENTVNFHLKNAMRKLNTNSRVVAVVRGIGKGLIHP